MIPDEIIIKAQRLYNFALALGYNHDSAIGVCANVMAESSFNEGASEVGGTGVGLGQWTGATIEESWNKLYAQGAICGWSPAECRTFDAQCDILLRGEETGQWSVVAYTGYDDLVVSPQTLSEYKTSTGLSNTTMNYMAHWERPSEDPAINHKELRKQYAVEFDSKIEGGGGGDGTQLAVFPFHKDVSITQGENGGFSHMGTMAIDFAVTGQTEVSYYAPFDCTCVYIDSLSGVAWQSDKPVKCVDGSVTTVSVLFYHDNNYASNSIGDKKKKGQLIGATGVAGNVTGDHAHFECSKKSWTGIHLNSQGVYMINDPAHLYDVFSICDNVNKTEITIGGSPVYPWKCMMDWDDGGTTPPTQQESDYITLLLVDALNGWKF